MSSLWPAHYVTVSAGEEQLKSEVDILEESVVDVGKTNPTDDDGSEQTWC